MTTTRRLRARVLTSSGRSVAGSLFASGSLQLLVILSGVLVARSLGPEDRGYFALLVVVGGVCALIGNLGLPAAVTYYVAREPRHARGIVSSLGWVFVLQLAGTLLLQACALVALVHSEPDRVKTAALTSLLLPPGILAVSYGIGILQGQRRFMAFNILRILPSVLYVVCVILVYFGPGADLVRLMLLWAGLNALGGFFALGIALRRLGDEPAPDAPPARGDMTRFGLKAMLGTLSPVDVIRLDQAVVGLFLNPVVLGLYVVAQAFTNLPRVVATSIGMVAYPHVAAEPEPDAARRAMWRFFALGLLTSALVVGGLEVMTGRLVTFFFGAEFGAAIPIAHILLFATFFMAARRVLNDGVNGIGKPGLGTIAEVFSWIVLVVCLAIFLPHYGARGVALALTVAWAASLLLLILLAVDAGRAPASRADRLADAFRYRLSLLPQLEVRQVLGLAGVAALAVGGGLAAAYVPKLAVFLVVLLLVGLVFAFGRKALAQHVGRVFLRRPHEATEPSPAEDSPEGAPLTAARRLYYGGVLLMGLLTMRAGGQVTFSDVLFLFSFLIAAAEYVILRQRVSIRLPFLLLIGIAMFSAGGFLSSFESLEPLKSIGIVGRLVFLTVFWFWLGSVVLQRREHVTKALGLWVASSAICGAGAVIQILGGNVPGGSFEGGRATGFTGQPNDLGGMMAIAFVPALMLASRPGLTARRRASSYVALLMIAAGLVLSGSVGAAFAAIAAIFIWLAFQRTSADGLLVFATLAACVVAMTAFQTIRGAPSPLDRLHTTTSNASLADGATQLGSVDQRIRTYRMAAEHIRQDPFVGVGLDLASVTRPFGVQSYEYEVHNLLIGLWYKTGLIGLVGMLLALLAIFRSGWSAMVESESRSEWKLAVALLSSTLAFVVFAMSEPVLFSRFGWIPAALVLALRAVQQQGSRSAEPVSQERSVHGAVLAPSSP
jgi:O-antigen/teichoic acid export membrane protein/O-antigen ligase